MTDTIQSSSGTSAAQLAQQLCKHCKEPIGKASDDPAYLNHPANSWMHRVEDGPDATFECGDEFGTQAEPMQFNDVWGFMFHAWTHVNDIATDNARRYALTDRRTYKQEFTDRWDAASILLSARLALRDTEVRQ